MPPRRQAEVRRRRRLAAARWRIADGRGGGLPDDAGFVGAGILVHVVRRGVGLRDSLARVKQCQPAEEDRDDNDD